MDSTDETPSAAVPDGGTADGDGDGHGDGGDRALAIDGELIVVSNREPYSHGYDDDGEIEVSRPAGGLTAGLDPVMERLDGTWIAWGDGEADTEVVDENDEVRVPPDEEAYTLKRLWLTDGELRGYYYGYSNRVLWPLCHGGMWKTEFAERYWQRYGQVNQKFADAVAERADADSVVWFQDYHFALAPRQVRRAVPEAFLMHFWHIPWPGWDTFRACPQRDEILEGLLGNDLLGFHVEQYRENFLDCADQALDEAFIDRENGRVRYDGHTTTVRAFPMGVDVDSIGADARSADEEFWREFRERHGIGADVNVALGIDRLDYTKGILERLNALERLFVTKPEWQGKLTLVQKASESRSRIPEYQDLQQEVEESVEALNDRFGTDDWRPVIYLEEWLTQEELAGIYRNSDLMLVSAVRDGMNLVAKEYVAAQIDADGALVLSDQTGAYEELGDDALTINPYDVEEFAERIEDALTMDDDERRERMSSLRETVAAGDLDAWMTDVFESARTVRENRRAEREDEGDSADG